MPLTKHLHVGQTVMAALTLAFMTITATGWCQEGAQAKCQVEGTGSRSSLVCDFPSCPAGMDCVPPQVDAINSQIAFSDNPILEWMERCPETSISGPCFKAWLEYQVSAKAEDSSGIESVGPEFMIESRAVRKSSKFLSRATQGQGQWQVKQGMEFYVAPGAQTEITAVGICARDTKGNEGCSAVTRQTKFELLSR